MPFHLYLYVPFQRMLLEGHWFSLTGVKCLYFGVSPAFWVSRLHFPYQDLKDESLRVVSL